MIFSSTRSPRVKATAATPLLLIVLCTAHFMDAIDLSDVTVAVPAVQRDLGLSTGSLTWIVSAYLLGYGGFLLLGGRASDVLGRRRVFLAAVAVFAVVSVVATLAPNAGVLIAARGIKGVAAGFLAPAALSLITSIWTEPKERGRAIGVFATAGAAGFVGGLVLGGLVTELSWRLAFALPLPFAIAVLVLAPRLLPRPVARPQREPLDVPGAVLVTLGFSAVVVWLTEAPALGWGDPWSVTFLVVGCAALCGFAIRQRLARVPLLPLSYLTRRVTIATSVTIATIWAAYTGFAFLATLGMQDTLGWSPLQAGLAFVPIGIVNGALAPAMGRLAGRIGAGRVVVVGVLLLTTSYALFFRMGPDATFLGVFLPLMVVNGLGLACTFAPLNLAALEASDPARHGLASAVLSTAQQLGGAVGLALVTAVTGASMTASNTAAATLVVVVLSVCGVAGAALLLHRRTA